MSIPSITGWIEGLAEDAKSSEKYYQKYQRSLAGGETSEADKLIADKVGGKDWEGHLGQSESLFVNASAWGLMLTGRIVELGKGTKLDTAGYLKRLITRSGEPVIRSAMKQAMRIMGKQFVLGRTIEEALGIAKELEKATVLPRLGLEDVLTVMGKSAGVVGVDSGLSHMAVALDLPHVQIYNFDTAWRTGPVNADATHVTHQSSRQVSVYAQPTPSLDEVWLAWSQVFAAKK